LEKLAMLRINHVSDPGQAPTLKLEGKLLGPWVDELRDACRSQAFLSPGICLDLAAITFVDAAGAKLLGNLIREGARIIACSGYVAELLHAGDAMNPTPFPAQASSASCVATGQDMPLAADGEADLLSRLRAGDEQACEVLVRQNIGRMLAVAQRFLGCIEDGADAVQEAFCSAFQAIDRFEGTSALSTWLHRIVVNVCLMRLRSRSRRRTISIDALLPAFDETGHYLQPVAPWSEQPGNRLERAETQNQVRACINLLPDDYRAVVLLRDIEELDTEETAEVLGISVPAVKTRLHRARQALRSLLEPLFTSQLSK
jgi:RNA polymerase sigma-70 factor (ECF subfamily)